MKKLFTIDGLNVYGTGTPLSELEKQARKAANIPDNEITPEELIKYKARRSGRSVPAITILKK